MDYSTEGATFQISTKNSITSEKIFETKPVEKKIDIQDIQSYLENQKKSKVLSIEETLSKEALRIVQKIVDENPYVEFAGTTEDQLISLLEQAANIDHYYHAAYYLLGLSYQTSQLWDKAIMNFNKSIALKPEYPEAYLELGRIYSKTGKLDEAILDFEKGIERNPEFPLSAHYELGIVYKKKGLYEDAIRELKNAGNPFAQFNLGIISTIRKQYSTGIEFFKQVKSIYLTNELYNEAIKVFNKELELNPNNSFLFQGLGYINYFAGKYELATQYFEKAKQLDQKSFDSFLELGISYFYEGKYKEAKSHLKKALILTPKDFNAHMYLGISYKYDWGDKEIDYWKRLDKALSEIETAVEIEPNSSWALYHLGDLFATKKDYDKAFTMLKKSIDLNPWDEASLSRIAYVYRMKKHYNEAIDFYKKALEIRKDAFTYSGLAEVYEEISEYDKATECLNEANKILKSAFFDEQIAGIYLKQKKYGEAIEIYKNILREDPKNTSARFNLAIALSDYGKRYEAISEYLKLVEIDPTDYASNYNIALLFMQEGTQESLKKAIKHFHTSITETPKDKEAKEEFIQRAKGLIEICNQRIAENGYPEKIRELSRQSGEVGFIASLLLAEEDYTKGNNLFISGGRNTEPVVQDSYYSKEKIVTEYIVSPDIFEAQALFKKVEDKIKDLKKTNDKYSDILDPFLKAAQNRIEGIEIHSKGYYTPKKDYRGEFEKGAGMIRIADSYFVEGLRNLAALMKKNPNVFINYDLKRISDSIYYYENKYKK